MKDIVKISQGEIGEQIVGTINAREIHSFLGIKTKFSMWIQRAIEKYDFVENKDYICMLPKNGNGKNGGLKGFSQKDYIITIDITKETYNTRGIK